MRLLLAPNAFKGTFDAVEVAGIWREALAGRRGLSLDARPLSDGGDGLMAVVRHYRPRVLEVLNEVPGPLGDRVAAAWGWEPERGAAVLESAAAIGLRVLGGAHGRPLEASSAGLGRLLLAASRLGARRLTVGLGGSATVDGGWGMARELGFCFLDRRGRNLAEPATLARLARIVPPRSAPLPRGSNLTALHDVASPLLGPSGAAAVYGPQKGATPADVERLEAGLARLAERWVADLGAPAELAERPGAGAAGGLGAACVAFLAAELVPGAAWCARLAKLAPALRAADAVVTGEGRWDAQSSAGKATGDVVARAQRAGLPVAVVCAETTAEPAPGGPLVVDGSSRSRARESRRGRVRGLRAPLERADLQRLVRVAVDLLGR